MDVFRKAFAEQHPEFINVARKVIGPTAEEILADSSSSKGISPPQLMCRCLAQTVLYSFYAMTLLDEHGCGADALKLARSMFETAVVLAAFDHFPELIDDYMEFRWIKEMKSVKEAKGTRREIYVSPEDERTIQLNYNGVLPKFSDRNGKPLSSWFRGSFKDLCDMVDSRSTIRWAVSHYCELYTTGSSLMHCDIIGLESQIDSSGFNIAAPPSDEYITESLVAGHFAMFWAFASYASIAGLHNAQEYGDRLLKSYLDVWGEGSREMKAFEKDMAQQSGSK